MSAAVTYAPYIPPVSGNYDLVCVALKWTDNPGPHLGSVATSCNRTAANFKRLSQGHFNFKPASFEVAVPYAHTSENLGHATAFAKKQLIAKHNYQKDTTGWVIVDNMAQGPGNWSSHTAGHTSYLLNTLTTTFYHEVGRQIPIGLGGSGVFKDGKNDYQKDGTSFMSMFSSGDITASQAYYLGWLPNTQVAVYDDPTKTMEFTLDPLNADSKNLKAVLMPNVDSDPLFLSRPLFEKQKVVLFALHRAIGDSHKSSERMAAFAKSAQYNNINIDLVSESGNSATVRISPKP